MLINREKGLQPYRLVNYSPFVLLFISVFPLYLSFNFLTLSHTHTIENRLATTGFMYAYAIAKIKKDSAQTKNKKTDV